MTKMQSLPQPLLLSSVVKTSEEHPEHLKATSSLEGVKEELSGESGPATGLARKEKQVATATGTTTTTTTATTTSTGATELGLKQGGVSLDPSHPSKEATTVSCCSHPGCSFPGTSSCGACKTTPYCGAKCQTADWPRHKVSCEGQLRKVGMEHLDKARAFARERNWNQTLRYANLAVTKLRQLKDHSLETIQVLGDALFHKCKAIESCGGNIPGRHKLAAACAEERAQLWHMYQGERSPGTIAAFFTQIECNLNTGHYETAENHAQIAYFLCEGDDTLIPKDHQSSYIAESTRLLALAILRSTQAGGMSPEAKQKAGEEAMKLARKSVTFSTDDPHSISFALDETLTPHKVLREVTNYFETKKKNKK